jgi:hypothetical protein
MITMGIALDSDLIEAINFMSSLGIGNPVAELFPTAAAMVGAVAQVVQEQWQEYASGAAMPSGGKLKKGNPAYANSIKVRPVSAWVSDIFSDYIGSQGIEEGTKEVDQKLTLPYGKRSRVTMKRIKGTNQYRQVSYLIVPFRWATPDSGAHMGLKNVIPDQIYNTILTGKKSAFKKSVVLDGKTFSPNAAGELQARATYNWGSRLKGSGGNIEGLVGMDAGTDKNGRSSKNYMTFRVISSDTKSGWVIPARPGMHVAAEAAKASEKEASEKMAEAFMVDIENHIGGGSK